MSFEACEKRVKEGDPDRFLSACGAKGEDRNALMAIYAVNLELARAPWASPEPLVAQMRLQWWRDELGKIYRGNKIDSHEILPALRAVIFDHNLPQALFDTIIEARMQDVYADPPSSRAAFDAYIIATTGSVMALAAKVLAAPDSAKPVVADFAYGAGVASLLRAVPALKARGRTPLIEPIEDIVENALSSLARARAQRAALPSRARPALLAGWRADATLKEAQKRPENIENGLLEESPAAKMFTLRWRRFTGRW